MISVLAACPYRRFWIPRCNRGSARKDDEALEKIRQKLGDFKLEAVNMRTKELRVARKQAKTLADNVASNDLGRLPRYTTKRARIKSSTLAPTPKVAWKRREMECR